jgi:putative ABC transport system permease protein
LSTLVVMVASFASCNVLYGYVRANLDMTRDAFTRWGARGDLILESPVLEHSSQEDGAKILFTEDQQRTIAALLRDDRRVARFARMLEISGIVANGTANAVFTGIGEDVDGVRAIKGPAYEYDVVAGEPLWQRPGKPSMILGQDLARSLGCAVPDVGFRPTRPGETPQSRAFRCTPEEAQLSLVTDSGQVNALNFPVTGIMDWGIREVNQRLVVLPLGDAQELAATTGVSRYSVQLVDESQADAVASDLRAGAAAHGVNLKVFRWSDRATFYHQVRGLLLGFLLFVLSISVLISFMSMLNTGYLNVMSRMREFGALRSMGFSKGFIALSCCMEHVMLAAGAAAVGALVAVGISEGIRAANLSWIPPGSSNAVPITVTWAASVYARSALGLLAVGALAALIPARQVVGRTIRESVAGL